MIIGLIAGWIAGMIMHDRGFGILGNIVVGVIGALIGGFVLNWFGFEESGTLASILTSVVGALILLVLVGLIRRDSPQI